MTNVSRKPIEENRKVQITGGSTYILSLPKKWITKNHVNKGTSVLVREQDDGSLTIIPSELKTQEKRDEALIKVQPTDKTEAVVRKVVSAYLVGYNAIKAKAQPKQQLPFKLRNDLKNFARQFLVGTEIVIDTSSELTLQVLLDYQELSVQSVLRRMGVITSSMHKDAMTALKKLDHQLAKTVVASDTEVDRFNLYIVRQLKLAISNPRLIKDIGLNSPRDCLGYRLITKSVERAADHAAKIAEAVLAMKHSMGQETLEKVEKMSGLAVSMFEESIESLFRQDFDQAEKVVERIDKIAELEQEAIATTQKTGFKESASLRLLIESLRRTAEYATDIAEIVLNLNVESVLN